METQKIEIEGLTLFGFLEIPPEAKGVVIFAHGSGSGRLSPRNQFVAKMLREGGVGTLLMDLLTEEEEAEDELTREYRFNIQLLASRLIGATDWLKHQKATKHLSLGYFGASTGAAAALIGAAYRANDVKAVVSRGGRPDLAGTFLEKVAAPTLLIVGGADEVVIQLNQKCLPHLHCENKLEIVPNATHLFEEPGTLEQVGHLARAWFERYL